MATMILTVEIIDECGFTIDGPARDAILDARSEMCDILNGPNGAIEKYNELTDLLGINGADSEVYIDCYESLTNECWTNLIHKRGFNYRIISEYIKEVNDIWNKINGITHKCVITVKRH